MNGMNKEVLSNAAALVKGGLAQWKPEMDLETVEKLLRHWQAEKFVGTMFGNKPQSELAKGNDDLKPTWVAQAFRIRAHMVYSHYNHFAARPHAS